MKRIIALVLSLVMALSLCAPAWGAGGITIPEETLKEKELPIPVVETYASTTDIEWGSFGQWSPTAGLDAELEGAYIFSCPKAKEDGTFPYDEKYHKWYCDFYVMLDRDLGENQLFLGGYYEFFGSWVGFHNGDVTRKANNEMPLLGSVTNNPWTYGDVKDFVGTFICGVGDVDDALEGATFTVMLRLTNPENPNEFYNVATVEYVFGGVAEVDGVEYQSLQDAVDAAKDGDTIVVKTDITEKVTVGKEIKIDTNGFENITIERANDNYSVTGPDADGVYTVVKTYKVKFNAAGGTPVPVEQTVNAGDTVIKPADPAKAGYTFKGWALGNAEYDFSTPVNKDITLVAVWVEEEKCTSDSHVKVLVEYSGDKATKVYCDSCGMTFDFVQGTEENAADKFGADNYVKAADGVWYTLKAVSGDVVVPPAVDDVVTAPEVEVVAPEVTVKVDTSDVEPEQVQAVQKAAAEVATKLETTDAVKVEEQKLADAAAEIAEDVADKVETIVADEHIEALDKLIESETVKAENVVLAVQTYVDIQVSEVKVKTEDSNAALKAVTLNITPMYQLVATTEQVLADPNTKIDTDKDSGNAVKVGDPKPMMVETMEVTIPLPAAFAEKLVYIMHEAAKGNVIYSATADVNGNVTFTTKSGFSPFTFSLDEIAVGAEVEGGDSYADLQSAVNYMGKDATVTVKAPDQEAVVGFATTFTVKYENGATKDNTEITAAPGYYLTTKDVSNGVQYTVSRAYGWGGGYVGGATTTPNEVVTSPNTFDAGIGMYVAMSVMAAAGSAIVIGKKKEF